MFSLKSYILPNLGIFYRYKNDIDVFVEDSYDDEFYKVLVNRVFENTNLRINKLIPLGDKLKVINACKADQQKRDVSRVYLVDGDLELITENNEQLSFLFVLQKYCIENYLIQEDALIEILHDSILIEKSKIKEMLNFQNWLRGLSPLLIEMFIHYSLSKKICPTVPTISLGVGTLCCQRNKQTVIDASKCFQRTEFLKTEILKVLSEEEYNNLIYELREKWPATVENTLKIVSGKDYLLPLIEFRFQIFKSIKSFTINRESLRIRLAKQIDISELGELRKSIG